MPRVAEAYLHALLAADREGARQVVQAALQSGVSVRDIYLEVFQPVQREVGRLWLLNRVTVAMEHFCTAATHTIMTELYPRILSARRIQKTLLAACVGPELHEIGMRMVADFFEMGGWDTYFLGSGVGADRLLAAIRFRKPDLVAISVTMTYYVAQAKEQIGCIRREARNPAPAIMVGGLPFLADAELWRSIGADLWSPDARHAVESASAWLLGKGQTMSGEGTGRHG